MNNTHLVCFNCRISVKGPSHYFKAKKCVRCNTDMINLGRDFKAPKKHNKTQWDKVFLLYQKGYSFGRSYLPKQHHKIVRTLGQAKKY